MPSGKARYTGNTPDVRDFTPKLRQELKYYFPAGKSRAHDPVWGSPAEKFVNDILAAASFIHADIDYACMEISKQDLLAEHNNLMNTLAAAQQKLCSLSLTYERLLPIAADPLGCADRISQLIALLGASAKSINNLPKKPSHNSMHHEIALEMAIRVLRILKDYSIPITASETSKSVKILKLIGEDAGLVLASLTWRDIVIEAKHSVP